MLVFLDTEFTDFMRPDLISIGLVAEDGREFYAERNDYRREDCNDFVVSDVLPLLYRVPNTRCSEAHLTFRLREWFEVLGEPVTLVFDYSVDWELLVNALLGGGMHDQLPINIREKWLLPREIVSDSVFRHAQMASYSKEWPLHHALADARALCSAYMVWHAASPDV